MNNYVYSFDLSLSSAGVCVWEQTHTPVPYWVFSIKTSPKQETKDRLRIIGETLLECRAKYPTKLAIFENGFSRFALSTQQIHKVIGVVSYLFADCDQIFYPPTLVKKIITGKGNADKNAVQRKILEIYPTLQFNSDDESDAVAVGLTYLFERKLFKVE